MIRRTCKTCKGAKIIRAIPNAQQLHRSLLPEGVSPTPTTIRCPTCKTAGHMVAPTNRGPCTPGQPDHIRI